MERQKDNTKLLIMHNLRANRSTFKRLFIFCLAFLSIQVSAQVNDPRFKDYFLMGRFGEVCTMCEIVVLCEAGEQKPQYEAIPSGKKLTLYHIQTRTFWSQMSTIWEWFIGRFEEFNLAARGHTRPVHVYHIDEGSWSDQKIIEGRLILDPGTLEFGEYHIDRANSAWIDVGKEKAVGFCQRMPLWESLDIINANVNTESPSVLGEKS